MPGSGDQGAEAGAIERKIFVCDWIPPEFGAVGQYTMKRAREAAQAGAQVILIGLGREQSTEVERTGAGELKIVRLRAGRNPKESFFRRALWALSVNRELARHTAAAQRGAAPKTTILVTGSPPLLSYWLLLQNLLFWRKRIIYRITDFYPEVALAAGKARWLAFAKPLFNLLRRGAYQVEVLGVDQARRLAGDPEIFARVTLYRDCSPVEDWSQPPSSLRPFGPDDCVLLYSGNLGVAHETATICEAYRRHIVSGSNKVRLWVNAQGVRVPDIHNYCNKHDLPIVVTPPAPLEALAGVLKSADAHLILLEPAFWGYVLPSKVYACLDSGQPVLYVGPEESDVHLLSRHFAREYWSVRPGDVDACVEALERLAARGQNPALPRRIDFDHPDLQVPRMRETIR